AQAPQEPVGVAPRPVRRHRDPRAPRGCVPARAPPLSRPAPRAGGHDAGRRHPRGGGPGLRRLSHARGLHARRARRAAPARDVRRGALMPENHRLINRELSWLEFNRRVLEEAQDPSVPLLERVKFLAIFSANLDEFYMVRVAGLKRLITAGDQSIGPDGMTAGETMAAVSALVRELVEEQHRCFLETLGPCLAEHNIYLVRPGQENAEQARYLEDYFQRVLLPVVTPLAVDPGHPFPHLANRAICLAVSLRPTVPSLLPRARLSLLHVPPGQVAPRFVALPARPDHNAFMLLEDVLRLHLPRLYPGYDTLSSHAIRGTRDAEVEIPRGRTEDLMAAIEAGLRERRMGDAVRLQYDPNLPPDVLATLVSELELTPADLYE